MASGFIGILSVILWVPVAIAYEHCSSYRDIYGRLQPSFICYADTYCCGSINDKYCCAGGLTMGAVSGIVFTLLTITGGVFLIVCCCNASCPLYRSRYRARMSGWWGQRGVVGATTVTTTTTAVNAPPSPMVVHHGAAAPMVPQYGQSVPGVPYRGPYPQAPQYAPPSYGASYGPPAAPPQYGAGPPTAAPPYRQGWMPPQQRADNLTTQNPYTLQQQHYGYSAGYSQPPPSYDQVTSTTTTTTVNPAL